MYYMLLDDWLLKEHKTGNGWITYGRIHQVKSPGKSWHLVFIEHWEPWVGTFFFKIQEKNDQFLTNNILCIDRNYLGHSVFQREKAISWKSLIVIGVCIWMSKGKFKSLSHVENGCDVTIHSFVHNRYHHRLDNCLVINMTKLLPNVHWIERFEWI